MSKQLSSDHFIGRNNEVNTFIHWLAHPQPSKILYLFDAAEQADKKGGVGKTWLLRRFAQITRDLYPETAVVMIDFFNVGDRDRLFLAEKIIDGIHSLYPWWHPVAFEDTVERYRKSGLQDTLPSGNMESTSTKLREEAYAALADDLRRLDSNLGKEKKTLLVLFDTFEAIEQSPDVAVLRSSQTFPDNYQFENMRSVIAGRNSLDWTQPNWRGREQEVHLIPLAPFSQHEMLEYVNTELIYNIAPHSKYANALYERTEGRPIIIGLTIDILNRRVQTLDELIAVSHAEFENYLVPQVNKLEDPLNWIILFMAHVYHRFNMSILEWILNTMDMKQGQQSINREELVKILPTLSFVRQPGSGTDFVLHDEMRRLVTKHCWEKQDTDKRFRRSISQSMVDLYQKEINHVINEQQRQSYIIEILYHRLFIDTADGLNYFLEQFHNAMRFFKPAFAHLLLQEAQKFTDQLERVQYNEIQLATVELYRTEDNPGAALAVLQNLRQEADPDWYQQRKPDLLWEEGRCYFKQSKLAEATDSYLQCLAIEKNIPNNESIVASHLTSLGLISRRRGQFAKALDYYEESINLYKKLGERSSYATVLTNISMIYLRQGKTEEAERRCKMAWRIRVDMARNNQLSEVVVGLSLLTLGQIYLDESNTVKAEKTFQEAYDIFLRTNNKPRFAQVYNRFGQVQLQKGNLEGARHWFIKAQEAAENVDMEQYINSLNKQGRIYLQQGDWGQAQEFFQDAIDRAQLIPDYYQETESLIDIASALENAGYEEQAREALQEAENIATRENYVALRGYVEQQRGEHYYHIEDYARAFQHFALYCQYATQYNAAIFNTAIQRVVDALLGLPQSEVPFRVQEVTQYWQAQKLDAAYPKLISALEEVLNDLM